MLGNENIKVDLQFMAMDQDKSKDKDKQVNDIDNNLTSDVLSRLPTKTLLGMKGVSKEWQRIISDRSFVQMQLKSTEPISGFFFQGRFQWCNEDVKSVNYIPAERYGTEVHHGVLDFLPESVVVQSSVHGLICCRSCFPIRNPIIYVCNPVNKEWITVPYPEFDIRDSIALSFDPFRDRIDVSTDFKVIRAYEVDAETEDRFYSFDVYTSRTVGWRKAVAFCQCNDNLIKNKGLFIDRKLYWLTDGDNILMFDLENEFSLLIMVPLPLKEFNNIAQTCIGRCEGQLYYVLLTEVGLQLWVLEDHFVSRWELKFYVTLEKMEEENRSYIYNIREKVTNWINIDSPFIDPLTFKDGLLFMRISSDIFLYNFRTGRMKGLCNLSVLGPYSMISPIVLPYTISLVPLDKVYDQIIP